MRIKVSPFWTWPVAALFAASCGDGLGPANGSITVNATGAPAGATIAVVITGPDQYVDTLAAGETAADLAEGAYTVRALNAPSGIHVYAPQNPERSVQIVQGSTPTVDFGYALASAVIAIRVAGVPAGMTARGIITGQDHYVRTFTTTDTVTGILTGDYVLTTIPIDSSGHTFSPPLAVRSLVVAPDTAPVDIDVDYALSTARAVFAVSGVPSGEVADVDITGPDGFQHHLTSTDTLIQLVAGSYAITPRDIPSNGHTFASTSYVVNLPPSRDTVLAPIDYAQITGTLIVTVTGLPRIAQAAIGITGPGGFSQGLIRSDTLIGIVAGSYTVEADTIIRGGIEYAPASLSTTETVQAGGTSQIDVDYQFTGYVTLNLDATNVYFSQAIQRPDGSVPLIADRPAHVRVFARGNETNFSTPDVRVRFYSSGVPVDSVTITAPLQSVPTSPAEVNLSSTFNAVIPGSLIQPNLSYLIIVDPDNRVPETDDSDNVWPTDGQPLALDVRALPPFPLTVVPVTHGATTGRVTAANLNQYLDLTRRMFPIGLDTITLHAAYTSSAGALEPDDANNAWTQTLSEIRALRSAEGSTDYYYGVVQATYSSGVAGYGYVPPFANSTFTASIGWDYLPSGSEVMTHELGHNFGRLHAPCGNPAGPDPNYPHDRADIGFYGIDLVDLTLKRPSQQDVMSYCNNPWVSDYTYEAVLARREASTVGAPSAFVAPSPTLLVWGRIVDDSLILEPSFEITGTPDLPDAPGPYRLRAETAGGGVAFDFTFEGAEVADVPNRTERHFAFRVPLTDAATIARVELSGPQGRVERRPASATTTPGPSAVESPGADNVEITWDVNRYPMVMVRDAVTNEVLSFARGGFARLRAPSANIRLVYSNGLFGPTEDVTPVRRQ